MNDLLTIEQIRVHGILVSTIKRIADKQKLKFSHYLLTVVLAFVWQ